MENHHYQHQWQHPANHPGQQPNYYPPPPPPHPHPPPHHHPHPPHHPQPPHQPQHQQLYFNRPDHFVEQKNNDHRHFNNPNPRGYSNFNNNNSNNNHMTSTSNEPSDSFGGFGSNARKRGRYVPDPNGDALQAKLYVAPVPSTSIEENVRPLFEEHGRVVQVVFPRDKRTGQQQGYCFVKYATMEEAEECIRALNGQYTFPGEMVPIKVKFADGGREHLGVLERERFGKGEREHGGEVSFWAKSLLVQSTDKLQNWNLRKYFLRMVI